jgi:quercetin dioxygenase-like cupin family protein
VLPLEYAIVRGRGFLKGSVRCSRASSKPNFNPPGTPRSKTLDPRPANAGHAHDYDIKGLVLDGVFIVYQDGNPVTYRAGEVFAVPAGKSHTEEIGPNGARIVVARKY